MPFVTIGPGRIEYESIAGDPKHPTIVMLHEGLGSVSMWKNFPERIARATRSSVVVYSRHGYGGSAPLQGARSVNYMHHEALIILPQLLDALGIVDPILFGHSDGASIALIHAGGSGRKVSGVIALAPHVFVEDISVTNISAAKIAYENTDLRERLARYHNDVDGAFWGWNNIWLDPAFRAWNIEEYLPRINCSLLAIQGYEDEYGTLEQIDRIARAAPDVELFKLEQCRHSPHRDRPDAVLERVSGWMQQRKFTTHGVPATVFAKPEVRVSRRPDGSVLLSSPRALKPYPRCVGDYLLHWAERAPTRAFLLERSPDGTWRGVTYRQALDEVLRVAGWLASRRLPSSRPVAILSDNSVQHAVLTLAAMHVGIPAMPISTAYSLASRDFAKLRAIIKRTDPSVIYVEDSDRYSAALAAIDGLHSAQLLFGPDNNTLAQNALRIDQLTAVDAQGRVASAFASVTPDTVAKLLFTSGSTDEPKAVITTHRMLCSNQQAKAQVWPLLEMAPPVIVDWLPWNHTFGGSHNFNLVLRNGGTLYIDSGRPTSGLFDRTIANLREIAPTIYFNVPRGYEILAQAMQQDDALRQHFFSRLQVLCYAAAALPRNVWDALTDLSIRTIGRQIPLVGAWGSTETAPLATDCHFQAEQPGVIGLPVPGCELKLIPAGGKLEVRVRGPLVSPGYWGRPDLTAKLFDKEGFYKIGDAVRFVDEAAPERGLIFDGRIAEDFKLTTGTWVSVGTLRMRAIAALAPIAQDIVVCGHDRKEIGFLIFPNIQACRKLCEGLALNAPLEDMLGHPALRAHISDAMLELRRETPASSTHGTRSILLAEPPSIEAGEITDKGYINQRAVLTRRHQYVEALYAPANAAVISLSA